MQAMRCGGRFVEIFLTTEVFWRNLHEADDDGAQTFQAITKDVQKATRIMQILCSEAKSRKDITLICKVCSLTTSDASKVDRCAWRCTRLCFRVTRVAPCRFRK